MAEARKSDFTGDVYGEWTVLRRAESRGDRKRRWVVGKLDDPNYVEEEVLQADLGTLAGDRPHSAQIVERVLAANAEAKQGDDNPFAVKLGPDPSAVDHEGYPVDVEPENPFAPFAAAMLSEDSFEPCYDCGEIEGAEEFVEDWVAVKEGPDGPFVLRGDSDLTIAEIGEKIFGKTECEDAAEVVLAGPGELQLPEGVTFELNTTPILDARSIQAALDSILKAKVALNAAAKTLEGLL